MRVDAGSSVLLEEVGIDPSAHRELVEVGMLATTTAGMQRDSRVVSNSRHHFRRLATGSVSQQLDTSYYQWSTNRTVVDVCDAIGYNWDDQSYGITNESWTNCGHNGVTTLNWYELANSYGSDGYLADNYTPEAVISSYTNDSFGFFPYDPPPQGAIACQIDYNTHEIQGVPYGSPKTSDHSYDTIYWPTGGASGYNTNWCVANFRRATTWNPSPRQ
jgi:hypothetical protein